MRREGDVNGAPFAVAVAVEERLVSIRSRALSKPEFEAELNITRAGCAGKLAERRRTDGGAGSAEIRVIERVEKLGSEFEVQFLRDRVSFDDGDVPLLDARPDQDIASGISETRRPIGQSL